MKIKFHPRTQLAFISISFEHKGEFKKEISAIKRILQAFSLKPICFVEDYQLKNPSPKKLMADALEKIRKSSILIAEVSYKEIGIGVEVGYAKALDIPIIYLRKINTPISTTVKGVCNKVIVYKNIQQLETKLKNALKAINFKKS